MKNGHNMLKDGHIDAANNMLRKQFPEVRGLKSPVMVQTLTFPVTDPVCANAPCWGESLDNGGCKVQCRCTTACSDALEDYVVSINVVVN